MATITTQARSILSHLFGRVTYTANATLHVGLSTANPTADGSGIVEPSGGSYTRVAVSNNTTNFVLGTGATMENGAQIQFPESTASWGTITHIVIFDAATSGNALYYGALTTSRTVPTATTIYFPISALTFTLS